MSLTAIKNEDLGDALSGEPEKKTQTIQQRFDQLAELILLNGDDIIRRRLSGEKVDKEETENQEQLQKNLKIMSQTIELMKKHGRVPNDPVSDKTFDKGDMDSILDKVKRKDGTIANINQKLS